MHIEKSDINDNTFHIRLSTEEAKRLDTMGKFRQKTPMFVLLDILIAILDIFKKV